MALPALEAVRRAFAGRTVISCWASVDRADLPGADGGRAGRDPLDRSRERSGPAESRAGRRRAAADELVRQRLAGQPERRGGALGLPRAAAAAGCSRAACRDTSPARAPGPSTTSSSYAVSACPPRPRGGGGGRGPAGRRPRRRPGRRPGRAPAPRGQNRGICSRRRLRPRETMAAGTVAQVIAALSRRGVAAVMVGAGADRDTGRAIESSLPPDAPW